MLENKDFEFSINVSTGSYPTKKPEKPWDIQYSSQIITISDLERYQEQGKSFCYNFKDVNEAGLITAHEKTLKGFDYTNVLFYDIDKMPFSMYDYIEKLPYKPTFAYTTISNGIDRYEGKYGIYGFRLIYAFQEPVTSIDKFDELYYAIASANGFRQQQYDDGTKYEFDYRKVNQQYYGGGYNSQTYKTDIIYSHDDFTQYVEKGVELMHTISGSNKRKQQSNKKDKVFPKQNNIGGKQEGQAFHSEMENPFFRDLFTLSPKDFISTYNETYLNEYQESLKTTLTLSDDGKCWIYPEHYQEVKRHWTIDDSGKRSIQKWRIGSGRKTRMYVTAQIMKFNKPNITREELIYNLVKERYYYYDNRDNNLNNTFIIQVSDSALSNECPLPPCKHPKFSVNKEYAEAMGMTVNTAKNLIRKEKREEEIMTNYDFGLSVKENLKIMQEKGIKVSKSYLYNMMKKYTGK